MDAGAIKAGFPADLPELLQINSGRLWRPVTLVLPEEIGQLWHANHIGLTTGRKISVSFIQNARVELGIMQIRTLKYVSVFMVAGTMFFFFDASTDIFSYMVGEKTHSLMGWAFLLLEIFSAATLIFAIKILVHQMRELEAENSRQSQSLKFLRGEMENFARCKFDAWKLSPAECDIAMYMLKGLSIADIAAARSTAEGTIKAQTSNIFRKTCVSSRTELMSLFLDEFLDIGANLAPPS